MFIYVNKCIVTYVEANALSNICRHFYSQLSCKHTHTYKQQVNTSLAPAAIQYGLGQVAPMLLTAALHRLASSLV